MSNSPDPTIRFSSRAADYAKYRPNYPAQVLDILTTQAGLLPAMVVADIGCGTGISSQIFVENGNKVFGVEPNQEMRASAERYFHDQPLFCAIDGTGEATTLSDGSVDLIVIAQAFHWLDRAKAAKECRRILRPSGGVIAVLWNQRVTSGSDFAIEFDQLLLKYCPDYTRVSQRWVVQPDNLTKTFGIPFQRFVAPNEQIFDLEGFLGRVRSSSYAPLEDQPGHDELYSGLSSLFAQHQVTGTVRFAYETELFLGMLR